MFISLIGDTNRWPKTIRCLTSLTMIYSESVNLYVNKTWCIRLYNYYNRPAYVYMWLCIYMYIIYIYAIIYIYIHMWIYTAFWAHLGTTFQESAWEGYWFNAPQSQGTHHVCLIKGYSLIWMNIFICINMIIFRDHYQLELSTLSFSLTYSWSLRWWKRTHVHQLMHESFDPVMDCTNNGTSQFSWEHQEHHHKRDCPLLG